jgi:hypothetical protein
MRVLTVDCVMNSRDAAWLKLPAVTTVRKVRANSVSKVLLLPKRQVLFL